MPVLALLWIRCSTVRAFGGVTMAVLPDKVVRDGLLLVLVVLAPAVLGRRADAPAVMMATVVGAVAALGLASLAVRRLQPDGLTTVQSEVLAEIYRRSTSTRRRSCTPVDALRN